MNEVDSARVTPLSLLQRRGRVYVCNARGDPERLYSISPVKRNDTSQRAIYVYAVQKHVEGETKNKPVLTATLVGASDMPRVAAYFMLPPDTHAVAGLHAPSIEVANATIEHELNCSVIIDDY